MLDQARASIKRAQAAGDPDSVRTYYLHWLAALEKLVARYRDAWDRVKQTIAIGAPVQENSRLLSPGKVQGVRSAFCIRVTGSVETAMSETTIRGADVLAQTLQRLNVRKIFSLSGNHIMPVYDALLETDIEIIHARHEAACVHMADAYSRVSGEVGFALVTGGPGHANAVAALFTSLASEAPMVLLSGHAALGS